MAYCDHAALLVNGGPEPVPVASIVLLPEPPESPAPPAAEPAAARSPGVPGQNPVAGFSAAQALPSGSVTPPPPAAGAPRPRYQMMASTATTAAPAHA